MLSPRYADKQSKTSPEFNESVDRQGQRHYPVVSFSALVVAAACAVVFALDGIQRLYVPLLLRVPPDARTPLVLGNPLPPADRLTPVSPRYSLSLSREYRVKHWLGTNFQVPVQEANRGMKSLECPAFLPGDGSGDSVDAGIKDPESKSPFCAGAGEGCAVVHQGMHGCDMTETVEDGNVERMPAPPSWR